MKSRFKFLYNMVKNTRRGKLYLGYYLLADSLDKIVFFLTLGIVKINLKRRVYKSYIKYRLKNT